MQVGIGPAVGMNWTSICKKIMLSETATKRSIDLLYVKDLLQNSVRGSVRPETNLH